MLMHLYINTSDTTHEIQAVPCRATYKITCFLPFLLLCTWDSSSYYPGW